jgi:hypothetical protein
VFDSGAQGGANLCTDAPMFKTRNRRSYLGITLDGGVLPGDGEAVRGGPAGPATAPIAAGPLSHHMLRN